MPRISCPQCYRPDGLCYCASIQPISNTVKVTIIQHPIESDHPFNTARIAELALKKCELITAETLSDQQLEKLTTGTSVLLYPDMPWLSECQEIPETISEIIVIDASWKKSKKILHLNPELQTIPRINLTNLPNSNYEIRLTSQPDGLSTIEAIYYALRDVDIKPVEDLLTPFNTMVSLQQAVAFSQKTQT